MTSGPEQSGQGVPGANPEAAELPAEEAAAADESASVAGDITAAGDTALSADATQVETDDATLATATAAEVAQQEN